MRSSTSFGLLLIVTSSLFGVCECLGCYCCPLLVLLLSNRATLRNNYNHNHGHNTITRNHPNNIETSEKGHEQQQQQQQESKKQSPPSPPPLSSPRFSWVDRVNQLIEFRNINGHTLVPKRYAENPSLGNWVNKQRQLYRKYLSNEPCSLTKERVNVLNDVGFCWDAKQPNNNNDNTHGNNKNSYDIIWWQKLEQFSACSSAASSHSSSSPSRYGSMEYWVGQQRREYDNYLCGENCNLDESKIQALNDVDPDWWKSFRTLQWERHINDLIAYREEHGDCCVPINYENKKLAHWVSNLRKKYNRKQAGRAEKLTSEQIQELDALGFVWDRWNYEYEKKLNNEICA